MRNASLKVEPRKALGGAKVRRLRKEGYIPAIVYGKEIEPTPVTIKVSDFRESLAKNGRNAVYNVELKGGKAFPIVIREIQLDAIKGNYTHVDLQQVSLTEKRRASVPVRITGTLAEGVILHQMDQVEVECLPLDTPEYIEADISLLKIGDSLTAKDLKLPANVEMLSSPEDMIATVTEIRQNIEENAEEEKAEAGEGTPSAENGDGAEE